MGREYTAADYSTLVDQIKEMIPDIVLTTDIICGFSTETEQDFEKHLSARRADPVPFSLRLCLL